MLPWTLLRWLMTLPFKGASFGKYIFWFSLSSRTPSVVPQGDLGTR